LSFGGYQSSKRWDNLYWKVGFIEFIFVYRFQICYFTYYNSFFKLSLISSKTEKIGFLVYTSKFFLIFCFHILSQSD